MTALAGPTAPLVGGGPALALSGCAETPFSPGRVCIFPTTLLLAREHFFFPSKLLSWITSPDCETYMNQRTETNKGLSRKRKVNLDFLSVTGHRDTGTCLAIRKNEATSTSSSKGNSLA